MVKPMKYRDLTRKLQEAGFTPSPGKGDHEKWSYPGIERPVIITKTREVSPAITRNALKAIAKKEAEEEEEK